MTQPTDAMRQAHRHSIRHRAEIERSQLCGCFHCLETFQSSDVERWLDEGDGTALCPHCQIDSVIGSASGYPVNTPEFLKAMQDYWFGYLDEASDLGKQ